MKIIDLYDMVAKGEQPKKFKYKDRWFAYNVDEREFRSLEQEVFDGDYLNYVYLSGFIDLSNLNDEIEVIEEPNKIEKLNYQDEAYVDSAIEGIFFKKINQIIDYINSKED